MFLGVAYAMYANIDKQFQDFSILYAYVWYQEWLFNVYTDLSLKLRLI